jgi:transposase InsO family protein
VVNLKGIEMRLPDALSRLEYGQTSEEDELVVAFTALEEEMPLFSQIQSQTKSSEVDKIIKYVQTKWPKHISPRLLPYTRDRMEYTVHNGCLYRGFRIVIPPALRKQILNVFHEFHPGIVKMKQLMRQFCWWPNMDADIQKYVLSCVPCQTNQTDRSNCYLSSWPECSRFFERLHIDICFYSDRHFLVIVDAYTGFVDVHCLSNITSNQVIQSMQKTFRYFGYPVTVVCDNGRQLVSTAFKTFLNANSIQLVLTPPYHSQSNGKAERAIRSLKLFLNKNIISNSSLSLVQHLSNFCMVNNFFPNANGTTPAREYLLNIPRSLMTKVLLSDKRGVSEVTTPAVHGSGSSTIPLENNRIAHAGGIIQSGDGEMLRVSSSGRIIRPNPRYIQQ